MSFNQSRPDKSDTNFQYRKSGLSASFNQQRGSSGSHSKSGGAGGSAPSIASNRSFRKSNNAQAGQFRPIARTVHSTDTTTNASMSRGVQNGVHEHPQLRGAADAAVTSTTAKPNELEATQKSTQVVSKAPQPASMASGTTAPKTPEKVSGDPSKAFPFQFGSISPGFVNAMQIPARTTSAPPNLDEQKREQARRESCRPVPQLPTPSAPKQQLQRKDAVTVNQSNGGEAHTVPKAKQDSQVSPAPLTNQTQKPSVPSMSGVSMPMPFHQPQVPVPFGGPNQQIQSPGMTPSSLRMPVPMPLQMASTPQLQQPIFVPGLQTHPMQPPGIVHQGQTLGFNPQIGSQPPAELGVNLGINIASQYPQQQGGKFGGHRNKPAVRITDPNTHEELRFDNKQSDTYSDTGLSGSRPHPNVPPQSQPIPSYVPSHPINYYTGSYNANSLFYPPSSLPLTSVQVAPNSHAHRFNYPVNQGAQSVSFMNPTALQALPVNPFPEHALDVHNITLSAPPATMPVTVRPPAGGIKEKVSESSSVSSPPDINGDSHKSSRSFGEVRLSSLLRDSVNPSENSLNNSKPATELLVSNSLPVATKEVVGATVTTSADDQLSGPLPSSSASMHEESEPVVNNSDGRRRENLSTSNSIKDNQKKLGKKAQHQIAEAEKSAASLMREGVLELNKESLSSVDATSPDTSESKAANVEGTACPSTEISWADSVVKTLDTICDSKSEVLLQNERLNHEPLVPKEQGGRRLSERHKDLNNSQIVTESIFTKSEFSEKDILEGFVNSTTVCNEVPTLGTAKRELDDRKTDNVSSSSILDSKDVGNSNGDCTGSNEVVTNSGRIDQHSATLQISEVSDGKHDGERMEAVGGSSGEFVPITGSKDKPLLKTSRAKSSTTKGKKKRKEILLKADAAGTTSDLYMAFKGPGEKKETSLSSESIESTSANMDFKQVGPEALKNGVVLREKDDQNKAEPDDWEDAADTPKLQALYCGGQASSGLAHGKGGEGHMAKKYTRDFLLNFAEQFTDLPYGFEVTPDIEALMSANADVSRHIDRDLHPSPGKTDWPSGGSRLDRRGGGLADDEKWNKLPGTWDSRAEFAYGGNVGFRPVQGANYGVLRNPRAQTHFQNAGGILSGPMQSMGFQGGMQRNNADGDRWQRATHFQQKGLIPSPHSPSQMMHKAEKKYEVGKVADEEEAKQRQLKGILNKLTPQNFEKLFEQVKEVGIDNAKTLTGVISQIFDKALTEPTFCEMYANFCFHLAGELPDFSDGNKKITFKRLLLNKCQEEFERGEREQEETNKLDDEREQEETNKLDEGGERKQSTEEREEKRIKARRRMLGNIRLIGELFKKRMLTESIMHECIKKLLGQYQNPDEEDIEALCKLMSTIGEIIDHPKAKVHIDAYFEMMMKLSNNMKLSSRVRFMLKDAIELRKNKWQQRRKVEGPKKIEEVHRDAAQEKQTQASRLGRGPGINPSRRGAPPMDFGPRGSNIVSSPNTSGFRGFATPARGYGSQDIHHEERHSYEPRTSSVPLLKRFMGDNSVTLGPQGGLGRGMSMRGPQSVSASPLANLPLSHGDNRRMVPTLNGYGTERDTQSSREDVIPRNMPDRFPGAAPFDQSSALDRSMSYSNRDMRTLDRSFERSRPNSPSTQGQGPTLTPNMPSGKVLSEDRLRDKSMAAIREFYSARDEKEVALCIKELNSPSFHPSMIYLWVTDSFERKDMERDLLAKLLVNLAKSNDLTFSQAHLIKGFEYVLAILEDTVTDAPKAPEFMGRVLAKFIMENLISLREIGRLIHEGGEEPGGLRQVGLAADVLGHILQVIRSEKGESVLNEILRSNSNLHLETFRPPDPLESRILEQFL